MSPEHHPRSLGGRSLFLIGVKDDFEIRVCVLGPTGSIVPNLKSLEADIVVFLLGVSRASPKESRRTFLIPDWS